MTSKTNLGLAAWAESMLGQPYWMETCCYKATASLLASKTKQYPDHYCHRLHRVAFAQIVRYVRQARA